VTTADASAESILDGYVVEEQVGFLLRRAQQRHAVLFQGGIGGPDLTPTQFTALIKVVEQGHATQNQLGRLAAMDPATIQGVVRRLEARGLVCRTEDPADRRTAVLEATPLGRSVAREAVLRARAITAATLEPLDSAERSLFLSLLKKLG
jgi:MarR family transcriptional regulator, lower aerobic nicotinate degradation pathway regulator